MRLHPYGFLAFALLLFTCMVGTTHGQVPDFSTGALPMLRSGGGNDGGDPPAPPPEGGGYQAPDGANYGTESGDDGGDPPAPPPEGGGYQRTRAQGSSFAAHVNDPAAEYASGLNEDVPVLSGNYPNPFNPETMVRFEVPVGQSVRLIVYNALGQQVRVLVDGWMQAGAHEARFQAAQLPSGIYFARLETVSGVATRTMILMK